jgi:MarR family transcriptional regulator, organic hydroperoxide resistance regulator
VAAQLTSVGPIVRDKTRLNSTPFLRLLNEIHHQIAERVSVAVGGRARLEEWTVLSTLADGAGHAMGDIADMTHTPPPSMTKLINRLVDGDLVYRRIDPVDRRRVLVFLSARGRSRYRRLQSLVDTAIAGVSNDEQLCQLVGELQRRIGPHPEPDDRTQRGPRPTTAAAVPTTSSGSIG